MVRIVMSMMICVLMVVSGSYAAGIEHDYEVGIDDMLDVNVLQPDQFSTTVSVSPDGSISFPYIGDVQVKGLTLKEIKTEIETRLADGFMKYPLVTVFLKESRSRKFFIYGDIARPGSYPLERDTAVLQAIALAGGFTRFNSSSRVIILRPQQDEQVQYQTMDIDIRAAMRGLSTENPILAAGDIVMVSQGNFFVYGEVKNPGVYPLEEGMTVLKAVSIAGGFTEFGSASRVKVLRPREGEPEYTPIMLDLNTVTPPALDDYESVSIDLSDQVARTKLADTFLRPGDVVSVSRGDFYVYGEVNRPGVYPLEEGMRVLKAIAVAGGFTKFGSAGRVKILRVREDNGGYESITVNIKEIMSGVAQSDIVLRHGDTVVVMEGVF